MINPQLKVKISDPKTLKLKIFPNRYQIPEEIELYDIKVLANSIFLSESVIKRPSKFDSSFKGKQFFLSKIDKIEIPLIQEYDEIDILLEQLFLLIFNRRIEVEIVRNPQRRLINNLNNVNLTNDFTCLFSGGIDSFSGILSSNEKYGKILGSYTHHLNQRTLKKRVQKLILSLRSRGINVCENSGLKHPNDISLTRGLLYTIDGFMTKRRNIIIAECGQTMYQPKYSPLDIIALTTNKNVLKTTIKLIRKITGKKINIILPNENLTKAEIVSNCVDKANLLQTHSCWRTGFASEFKRHHDGTCLACVLRRSAFEMAGLEENYENDIYSDHLRSSMMNNILSHLNLSYNILKDFDKLQEYSKESIKQNGKLDLFQRAAMDIFCSLYLANQKIKIKNRQIINWLNMSKDILSNDEIENRLCQIKERKHKPNFDKKIS